MRTLIICEKGNAARRISRILSGNAVTTNKRGRMTYYSFEKGDDRYNVIGLRGHIITLDYPSKYNKWKDIDPAELVWKEPYKRVHAHDIGRMIKELVIGTDQIIIATDYDREGELIGVESLEAAEGRADNIKITRAKFSALTKMEIENAFKNLHDVDYNLAKAAESRQYIDLVWGASLTRFISLSSHQTGRDFLSVGRVQSPTLALIVDREREIEKFVPVPYWELYADLEKGKKFVAKHATDRFDEQAAAQEAYKKTQVASEAKVKGVAVVDREDRPPIPYSTTLFLADATRQGMSAAKAMAVAEDLYTDGILSYPRTDNTVYPPSLGLKYILERLKESDLKKEVEEIQALGKIRPTRGKVSTTDHPPIHPVKGAYKKDLKGERWTIYELVVRRFLATLAPNSHIEEKNITLDIKGEPFKARGTKIMEPGWRKYFPYYRVDEVESPPLAKADKVKVDKVRLESKETQPPRRYSQAKLLKEMERLLLGTKSTRHEIMQKLLDRGYVDTRMSPTATGFAVVEALEKYAERVTQADMTSTLEKDMSRIADGEITMDKVIEESKEMLGNVFVDLKKNEKAIGESIQSALKSENLIGKCDLCPESLMIRKSRRGKRFAGCSGYPNCRNTYPLPQRGKILPTDMRCRDCDSPVIKVIEKGQKPWITCINMKCPGKQKTYTKKSTTSKPEDKKEAPKKKAPAKKTTTKKKTTKKKATTKKKTTKKKAAAKKE